MPKLILLAALLLTRPLLAASPDLHEQIALLGGDFIVHEIPAPVLERPADWINRGDGDYHYRYTAGDDHGRKDQIETHRYDPDGVGQVWHRHIGDTLVESFALNADQGIRFHREIDRHHGYRVDFSPGVTIPPGVSTLVASHLDTPDQTAFRGRMTTNSRYLGAWRIRVPAGEYDAVLIEQTFEIAVGPLKANDVRHLFYARGAGVVAEVEALRASAMIVMRVKEKSAKVLIRTAAAPSL